jgi:transcription-repair coupling factor (superfamily II helicase)
MQPEATTRLRWAEMLRDIGSRDHTGQPDTCRRDDRRLDCDGARAGILCAENADYQPASLGTVPYDRVGPNPEIVRRRMTALARLALRAWQEQMIVLTTVNAILQRLPPRPFIRQALRQLAPGQRIDLNRLVQRRKLGGYIRTGTVMEPGEFAVRGGILDLFPPGRANPVRLDFFVIRSRASDV